MKHDRLIQHYRALLTRAIDTDQDMVKQYVYGLNMAQVERIKELEKELALIRLTLKYKGKL